MGHRVKLFENWIKNTPVVPPKPYPIQDQNGENVYPFSDQNGTKTLPDGAAYTYIAQYPPPPPPLPGARIKSLIETNFPSGVKPTNIGSPERIIIVIQKSFQRFRALRQTHVRVRDYIIREIWYTPWSLSRKQIKKQGAVCIRSLSQS